MKLYFVILYFLIFSPLTQSNANIISKNSIFKVTAEFDQPGHQSWIFTALTPENNTSSYDGCNWHHYGVYFNLTINIGYNFTLVILEDETIMEESNVSNYPLFDNISIFEITEQNQAYSGYTSFPFEGGDSNKLKVILYYEGRDPGSLTLSGGLGESQTLLGCIEIETTRKIENTFIIVQMGITMVLGVRLRREMFSH